MRPRLYLIELFAGTHSVSNSLKRSAISRTHELCVLSVDIDEKFEPAIVADINRWDFEAAIGEFLRGKRRADVVVVHASPPCTEFSRALTTRPRDLRAGNRNVKRALLIIDFVDPDFWFLENPATGLLKDQPCMRRYESLRHTTCYCRWGFPYRKPTSIWTSVPDLTLPMCDSVTQCRIQREHGRHLVTAQAGPGGNTREFPGSGGGEQVYGLPQNLVRYLFKRAIEALE